MRILITLLLALSVSSCQKKSCYKCILGRYPEGNPAQMDTSSSMSVCDQTEKEMERYIEWYDNETSTGSDGTVWLNKADCIETTGL